MFDVSICPHPPHSTHSTPNYSVHDGWGVAAKPGLKGNAIEAGTTTNMDTIGKEHSQRTLSAHGIAVGLSEGLMGNSEVG
jgi:2,3-bisphosphoglycerate-independent phosphoglycerate mutase